MVSNFKDQFADQLSFFTNNSEYFSNQ